MITILRVVRQVLYPLVQSRWHANAESGRCKNRIGMLPVRMAGRCPRRGHYRWRGGVRQTEFCNHDGHRAADLTEFALAPARNPIRCGISATVRYHRDRYRRRDPGARREFDGRPRRGAREKDPTNPVCTSTGRRTLLRSQWSPVSFKRSGSNVDRAAHPGTGVPRHARCRSHIARLCQGSFLHSAGNRGGPRRVLRVLKTAGENRRDARRASCRA